MNTLGIATILVAALVCLVSAAPNVEFEHKHEETEFTIEPPGFPDHEGHVKHHPHTKPSKHLPKHLPHKPEGPFKPHKPHRPHTPHLPHKPPHFQPHLRFEHEHQQEQEFDEEDQDQHAEHEFERFDQSKHGHKSHGSSEEFDAFEIDAGRGISPSKSGHKHHGHKHGHHDDNQGGHFENYADYECGPKSYKLGLCNKPHHHPYGFPEHNHGHHDHSDHYHEHPEHNHKHPKHHHKHPKHEHGHEHHEYPKHHHEHLEHPKHHHKHPKHEHGHEHHEHHEHPKHHHKHPKHEHEHHEHEHEHQKHPKHHHKHPKHEHGHEHHEHPKHHHKHPKHEHEHHHEHPHEEHHGKHHGKKGLGARNAHLSAFDEQEASKGSLNLQEEEKERIHADGVKFGQKNKAIGTIGAQVNENGGEDLGIHQRQKFNTDRVVIQDKSTGSNDIDVNRRVHNNKNTGVVASGVLKSDTELAKARLDAEREHDRDLSLKSARFSDKEGIDAEVNEF